MIGQVAYFSFGPGVADDGGSVRRPGKLFELGSWPEKSFSLNATEADAVAGFTVPLEIEHVPSIFDGKLGTATFTGRNGVDLNGFLTLPKVIDDLHGPTNPLKVSVVWDTATKKPLRVGLVLNPAITDAQVTAAFSASSANPLDPATVYAARLSPAAVLAAFSASGTDAASIYAARMQIVRTGCK